MNKSTAAGVLVALCLVGCDLHTTPGEMTNREMPLAEDLIHAPTVPAEVDPTVNPLAELGGPGTVTTPRTADVLPVPVHRQLTDDQIVRITELVDRGELEQANMAAERASDAQVKNFAAHMLAQHTKSQQLGKELINAEGLAPAGSLVAQALAQQASETLEDLRDADAASFDAKYMNAQIDEHQHVSSLLDETLIPRAASGELRARLEETRAMVQSHLEEARHIREGMASAGDTHLH
jgi:putative membrane protein